MRIVHLSRSDLMGGAAKAAFRLHRELVAAGEDSTMLVEDKLSDDPRVVVPSPDTAFRSRLRRVRRARAVSADYTRYLLHRPVSARLFSDDRGVFGVDVARLIVPDAILTLHWIARFIAFGELLNALGCGQPFVWRLADMNPFTGGCHYDDDCGRYRVQCGHCPMLASPGPRDLSHAVWRRKASALERLGDDQLHLVAVSRDWARRARSSSLLGRFKVSVIPPCVDVDVYRPLDRQLARQSMGLEVDGTVLLLVASSLDDPLKGGDLLCDALSRLSGYPNLTLLTVGDGEVPGVPAGMGRVHLGYVSDETLSALAFNCADAVVLPSRQEAFGQVVIEALACGVPVVGFSTGGIEDAIIDGANGFVAPEVSVDALHEALERALTDPEALSAMAEACRDSAVRGFSGEVVTRRYLDLYRSVASNVL